MDNIEQLLAVKTRLTTIKGYAQLLEREINRERSPSNRLTTRIAELNHEVARLIELVEVIETSITDGATSETESNGDDYISSAC